MNSPGLPVHALHPEFFPAGVQQQHLLLNLKLLFRWQISLGHQLVSSLQNIAHTALVRSQFHHKTLEMVQADTSLWGPFRVYDLVNTLKNYHVWNDTVEGAGTIKCMWIADLFLFLTQDFQCATKLPDPVKQTKKANHLNERSFQEKRAFKQTHQEYETRIYLWQTEHKTSEMYCRKAVRTLWVSNIYLL